MFLYRLARHSLSFTVIISDTVIIRAVNQCFYTCLSRLAAACCSGCPPSSNKVVFIDLAVVTTAAKITEAYSIGSSSDFCSVNVSADDASIIIGIVIEDFNERGLRERLAFSAASSSDGSRNHS